jgi:hypothetical protein
VEANTVKLLLRSEAVHKAIVTKRREEVLNPIAAVNAARVDL